MPIITGDAVLAMVNSSAATEIRRSMRVIRAAHKARTKDNRPDWQTQLKAAEIQLRVLDAFPKPTAVPLDASRPVNVVFVLNGAGAQDQLQADGLTLSLGDGGGEGT